jgi:hypothetical protein
MYIKYKDAGMNVEEIGVFSLSVDCCVKEGTEERSRESLKPLLIISYKSTYLYGKQGFCGYRKS